MLIMGDSTCPVSGSRGRCPAEMGSSMSSRASSKHRRGPAGCAFSGFSQPGDLRTVFDVSLGNICKTSDNANDDLRFQAALMLRNGCE